MKSDTPSLTIVTYHYVRDIAESKWPGINGLERKQFAAQLDYLLYHHTVIDMSLLFAHARGEDVDWPERPVLLTFDDGYSDHFESVFHELLNRKVPGAFFAPTTSLLDRRMLDVNKVHFVLAAVDDHERLAREIDGHLHEIIGTGSEQQIRQFHAEMEKASRWDPPATVYVKRVLQRGPKADVRTAIASKLFQKHVSVDETGFAEELYMTVPQAQQMVAAGMHFGSHGDQHIWFNHNERSAQEQDIVASFRLRDALDLKPAEYSFCYPYGGYDATTLELMSKHNFTLGLTTRLALNQMNGKSCMLELARIDGGADVPEGQNAPLSSWTVEAKS
jgi:peptidoglycan/xylan/chitin deacetylase (PgdA/CDA1 family)